MLDIGTMTDIRDALADLAAWLDRYDGAIHGEAAAHPDDKIEVIHTRSPWGRGPGGVAAWIVTTDGRAWVRHTRGRRGEADRPDVDRPIHDPDAADVIRVLSDDHDHHADGIDPVALSDRLAARDRDAGRVPRTARPRPHGG